MKTKSSLAAALAATLIAGAGPSLATAATPNALDLSLPGSDPLPAVAAAPVEPAKQRAEAPHDQSVIDDCFAYATGGGLGSDAGQIPRFASRAGPGAEEQAFQRQLKAAAPDAMRERLFAHCLAAK